MKSVLDSRQLLAARILADTGSFTLAGMQLSLTQSAVSHAIKALEEEVECRLFVRTGKGVKVTAAGKHFLEYTDKILLQMETARTLVAPRAGRGKERLRLGVSNQAREFILPVVLPAFQREFPNKLVALEPGDFQRNLELLESGLLDLAIMVRPVDRPEFGFFPLFEDELQFYVSAGHPWARRGRPLREELTGRTLLVYLGMNNTAEVLAEYFRAEGLAPCHRVELANHDSVRQMINTNLAVGVVFPRKVNKEVQAGSLVPVALGARPLLRQWGVVYQRKRSLAPMEKRFVELSQLAVPGILSRMQGQPVDPHEKKEAAAVPLAEPSLQYGGVALFLSATYNFFSDSTAWENFGSILSAAS